MNLPTDFEPSGFFALRTPLLPFDELVAWGRDLPTSGVDGDDEDLARALGADLELLRRRLGKAVLRPEAQEAIFVASPSLHDDLSQWSGDFDKEKALRIERTLVRYFTRMAARSTPFGLFSGCSFGRVDKSTELLLEPRARYSRRTRLDMEYLSTLCEELSRDEAIRNIILYQPNPSLYEAAGRFRYVETKGVDPKTFHLVGVESTAPLVFTLNRARDGVRRGKLIADLVEEIEGVDLEEAGDYVDELINCQILIPNLSPALTGMDPVLGVTTALGEGPAGQETVSALRSVSAALDRIDASGLQNGSKPYLEIAETLKEAAPAVKVPKLFQVDMLKPVARATLGPDVVSEVSRGIRWLTRLFGTRDRDRLKAFREEFYKRYEGREVSLNEVLDEEIGIGFEASATPYSEASPLLKGIGLPPVGESEGPRIRWGPAYFLLLRKFTAAMADRRDEIVLDEEEIESLPQARFEELPDAFEVFVSLSAENDDRLAQGDFQVLIRGGTGPSGVNLLGRFCAADPEFSEAVQKHLRREEALQPDAVFAEIVHLPDSRSGNIIARPILRRYEIPCLTRAGVSAEHQISVDDLFVSLEGGSPSGRILLRSRRLGREVVPRLTSAHNVDTPKNVGVYRFLNALQSQDNGGEIFWDWGPLFAEPFLPRVRCSRVVLTRASWIVTAAEIRNIAKHESTRQFVEIRKWRSQRNLPRWIVIVDGDKELPVDLENMLSVEAFLDMVGDRPEFRVVELFPSPETSAVKGPEGRFAHEIIVPFLRVREPSRERSGPPSIASGSVKRSFVPGSEWLYAKLFTGTSTADIILRETVYPLIRETAGLWDRWFFIRYADPDWHIRLRFHGDAKRLTGSLLPMLQERVQPLVESGRVWKLTLDTYERELERYGAPEGILLHEAWSHFDSEAVLEIIDRFRGEQSAEARWKLTARGVDALLSDLGFGLADRLEVVAACARAYGGEYGNGNPAVRHQLSQRYREERAVLADVLDPSGGETHELRPGFEAFRRRSERLAPVIAEFHSGLKQERPASSLVALSPSFIHMHANRMLRSAARAQEFVIYDFLQRHYRSQAARENFDSTRSAALTRMPKLRLKK